MENLLQDLRYGLRALAKSPGFTAVALISLALSIGINTTIFTLIESALLRTLPVENPDELVLVLTGRAQGLNHNFSYPGYADYRARNEVFSGLLAYSSASLDFNDGAQTERIPAEIVSGNYFTVLGVKPALGRTFLPDEDRTPGTHPVAVVSYGLWQRRLGGDPDILRKSLILNRRSYTVIGVAPRNFPGANIGRAVDVWVPMMMQAHAVPGFDLLTRRGVSWLFLIGRLKSGVSREQGEVGMDTLFRHLQLEYPREGELRIVLLPGAQGHTALPKNLSLPLLVLMGAAGFVLLIASSNIANLLLARAAVRGKEIAVRLALGATRRRILRQLLTESLLISLVGGTAGVLLAHWSKDLALALVPSSGPGPAALDVSLGRPVLGFALLLSIMTGVLFGLAPAITASRPDLVPVLKVETVRMGGRSGRFGLRNLLVILQIALSLVLLVGAGLFIRSLQKLRDLDLGFEYQNVLLASIDLEAAGYNRARATEFYQQLVQRVEGMPGVSSASLARVPPVNFGGSRTTVIVENYEAAPNEDMELNFNIVGLRYFETLGIPLLRGRDFTIRDRAGAPGVVIINETMARRYWQEIDPIGKRISTSGREGPFLEVIGIAKDGKYRSMREQPRPSFYLPLLQNPRSDMVLHTRTAGDPSEYVGSIRREVRALDKDLPVFDIKTLSEQVNVALAQERMTTTLSSTFGLIALLLAAVGVYGVMAYSVSRRTHEIGIRMALGARPRAMLLQVMGESMAHVMLGIALGTAMALFITRALTSFLYGVSATDMITFSGIALLLALVALVASYIPARRASRVDPMTALRCE